jgi:hypothetical protein
LIKKRRTPAVSRQKKSIRSEFRRGHGGAFEAAVGIHWRQRSGRGRTRDPQSRSFIPRGGTRVCDREEPPTRITKAEFLGILVLVSGSPLDQPKMPNRRYSLSLHYLRIPLKAIGHSGGNRSGVGAKRCWHFSVAKTDRNRQVIFAQLRAKSAALDVCTGNHGWPDILRFRNAAHQYSSNSQETCEI